MKAVSKSRLKAKMLEYFRHVEETGEELIVTSHGTPTLKIVPFAPKVTPETALESDFGGDMVVGSAVVITQVTPSGMSQVGGAP